MQHFFGNLQSISKKKITNNYPFCLISTKTITFRVEKLEFEVEIFHNCAKTLH